MTQSTPRFVIGKEARLIDIAGSGISSATDGQTKDGRGRAINYPSPKVAVGFLLSSLDPVATKITPCRTGEPRRTERSTVAAPVKILASSSPSGGATIPCVNLTSPARSLISIADNRREP